MACTVYGKVGYSIRMHRYSMMWIVIGMTLSGIVWWLTRPCKGIACIKVPGAPYRVRDIYEDTGRIWRGLLQSGDTYMRLETIRAIPSSEAGEYTQLRLAQIEGLFDTAASPYPGAISHTIRCDDAYKPKPVTRTTADGTQVTFFSSFMNSRMQYGVCMDNQITYRSYTGMFHCQKSDVWVSLEMIVPYGSHREPATYEHVFTALACK